MSRSGKNDLATCNAHDIDQYVVFDRRQVIANPGFTVFIAAAAISARLNPAAIRNNAISNSSMDAS